MLCFTYTRRYYRTNVYTNRFDFEDGGKLRDRHCESAVAHTILAKNNNSGIYINTHARSGCAHTYT